MQKTFIDARFLSDMQVEAYGVTYLFRIENFENVDGYARCLIYDATNDERYHTEGYIELNNHIIITKWKREYDSNRENFICSHDLLIEIQ
jgi:hypothetical protein